MEDETIFLGHKAPAPYLPLKIDTAKDIINFALTLSPAAVSG